MKKLFKVMTSFVFLMLLGVSAVSVKAVDNTVRVNKKTVIETKEIVSGLTYEHDVINSSFGSNVAKDREVYTYTMDKDAQCFVATWTYSNPTDYILQPLTAIARDYEKNHPGYIVLTGINAEGFNVLGDPLEITGPFIQDGDVIRKDVSTEAFKECIGWYADGTHVIKRVPQVDPYMTLTNFATSEETPIESINKLPTEGGIGLYTEAFKGDVDFTGYHVYTGVYSLYRVSRTFPSDPDGSTGAGTFSGRNYGIFVKGDIRTVDETTEVVGGVKQKVFYLVSETPLNIQVGNTVKAEYKYSDEFRDLVSMTSVWFRYVRDGEPAYPGYYQDWSDLVEAGVIPANDGFYYDNHDYLSTESKQRAGFGFTADGDTVFIVSNTGIGGPSAYEVGNYLRDMGVVDGYLVDNGGSSTMIRRNLDGSFEMINEPADGHPRSLSTGILVVMKDPGFGVKEKTRSTATFDFVSDKWSSGVSNVVLHVNNKTYNYNGSPIVVNGLDENTTYEYYYTYKLDGKDGKMVAQCFTTDGFKRPTMIFTTEDLDGDGFIIKAVYTEYGYKFDSFSCVMDGVTYYQEEDGFIHIKGLEKSTDYVIDFKFSVIDDESGNKYTYDDKGLEFRTLSYIKPKISECEIKQNGENISISYKVVDKEKDCEVYYSVDGKETKLDRLKDTVKFSVSEDAEHEIQLIVKYGNKSVKSEIFKTAAKEVAPATDKKASSGGCSFGAIYAASVIALAGAVVLLLKRKAN